MDIMAQVKIKREKDLNMFFASTLGSDIWL